MTLQVHRFGLIALALMTGCSTLPPPVRNEAVSPALSDASLEQWASSAALMKLGLLDAVAVTTVMAREGKSVCGILRRPDGQVVVYQYLLPNFGVLMAHGAKGQSARDRQRIDRYNAILADNCRSLGADLSLGG